MTHFDVLRQSWIPAEGIDGVVKEYGILDILLQAKSLRSIVDSSPLFQYGMYRLLIALLSDAIRPRNIDDLLELFEQGEFPLELLNNYIAECEKDGPCFDLFDKHKPFLQSAYDEDLDKTIRSVALLAYELPSGNNTTHFDHRAESEHAFCPEICARALTAINVFCTAGLQGPSGINGAPPWYVLVRGGNLFETLILNIWIPNLELPFDDPPIAWRNRSRIIPGQSVKRTSYLYGLTWQPRRILLQPLEENGVCSYSGKLSNVMIRQMYFQKGWKFEGYALWTDPHTPRSISEDAVSSVKPREGKAVWRDLAPFLLST
ncbi:MAG: type I-E CRISPR-associated protein Cse1/CasA, partial [Syntrophomonadaceae bacterium]|nr:type I-E CRISPR-associated protein Cse1/CasA [Syntrophomonadaceae bacterium]